jgi:outer membrane protein assembly factor BamB
MLALACAALVAGVESRAKATDWPMYLYNPAHSSYNASETHITTDNVTSLKAAWTFSAQPLGGGVTVVNGVVYVGDWGGNFYAIRAAGGSLIWQQSVGIAAEPDNPVCQPAIGVTGQSVVKDGVVYVPGGDSAIYALDQNTGSQIWRVALSDPVSGAYIWSSLTLVDNSIFLGIASLGDCPLIRGALIRIDLNDPLNPVIKYLAPPDAIGAGIWSTPAVDVQTNTLYATTGTGDQNPLGGVWGSAFLSFNAKTLDIGGYYLLPLQEGDVDIEWGSSPTLFQNTDGTPLVAATGKDGFLYCLKRSDMSVAWTAQLAVDCDNPQGGCGSLSTPAFDGNALYVGAGVSDPDSFSLGTVYAFSRAGEQLWNRSLSDTVIAPVTVANGMVFVSTLSGLVVLNAGTGEQLWDDGGMGSLYGQPVVVDGTVYAPYVSGSLVAYRVPEQGRGSSSPRHPHQPHR